MKPSPYLTTLLPLPLAASITTNPNTCPGSVWNNICCIGHLGGPSYSAFQSSQSGLQASLSSAATSRQAALSSRLTSVTGMNAGITTDAPDPGGLERRLLGKRMESEIDSGVTCYGSAISLGADGYSSKLAAAASARKAQGEDFTKATGAVMSTGSSASGSAQSSSSDGAAPQVTGGAVLLGGMAGAMVYGAI